MQSPIILGLELKHLGISSAPPNQTVMVPTFDDTASFHHVNRVCLSHSAKAVAHKNGHPTRSQLMELLKDLSFGLRIQCAGRLIHYENLGVPQKGSS